MPGRAPRHPQDPVGCRWIDGEPGRDANWSYCQEPTLPGTSWCAAHHARCFTAPAPATGQRRASRAGRISTRPGWTT